MLSWSGATVNKRMKSPSRYAVQRRDSVILSENKVELSQQASQFYHDTIRTLHLVKECTDRLQELFAVMSSIIKQFQSRPDLVKPFEVVCDKFLVSYDEVFPLSNKTK